MDNADIQYHHTVIHNPIDSDKLVPDDVCRVFLYVRFRRPHREKKRRVQL